MRVLFISFKKKLFESVLLLTIGLMILALGIYLNNMQIESVPAIQNIEPIYQGNENYKNLALTCNVAWGEEFLPQMLDILKENNVKITFFVEGRFAEKFPKLVNRISQQGHEIGSHGYSHPHVNNISKEKNIEEIRKTEKIIQKITGKKPVLFAPPYGERDQHVLEAANESGYKTVLWSIDTVDWQRPSPSTIVQRVTEKAHNGAIVLMHPTAPTISALPVLIKELKKQNYNLVTVSMMLTKKG